MKPLYSRILIKHIKGFGMCKMRAKMSALPLLSHFVLYLDYVHSFICIALEAIWSVWHILFVDMCYVLYEI